MSVLLPWMYCMCLLCAKRIQKWVLNPLKLEFLYILLIAYLLQLLPWYFLSVRGVCIQTSTVIFYKHIGLSWVSAFTNSGKINKYNAMKKWVFLLKLRVNFVCGYKYRDLKISERIEKPVIRPQTIIAWVLRKTPKYTLEMNNIFNKLCLKTWISIQRRIKLHTDLSSYI